MRFSLSIFVLLTGFVPFCNNYAQAAESEFVGVLALLADDEVAQQLGLSSEVKEKIADLIERREQEVLSLVLEIKDLEPSERATKLAPFVAASEKEGLALLTAEQRTKLERIRIGRKGLLSLTEESVARQLNLTEEQTQKISAILLQREEDVARGRPDQARTVAAVYDRKLAALLTEPQRAAWEKLAMAQGLPTPVAGETEPPTDWLPSPPRLPAQPKDPAAVAGDGASDGTQTDEMGDGKLRFSFRYAPWKDVLDWFATEAGLSLQADTPPPGTFNYTDSRRYSPAEAIDVINSVLLTKGYTLVRRDKSLMLINLEDGIPPNLVPQVPLGDLDKRGEFEMVSCLFTLDVLTPTDAQAEIEKLLGPQGSLIVLPKAKQVLVTETAGRLRTIRQVIEAVENPDLTSEQRLTEFKLEHAGAEEVMETIRQLIGLPADTTSAPDGSVRIALDPLANRLIVTGKVDAVTRVGEIIKLTDVPLDNAGLGTSSVLETPQLEVYTVPLAEPATVLQVLQTILAGGEETRLTIDEGTGNLVALARPSQHATIRATIAQMERDGRQVDVIRLRYVDPQLAVLSINKLFGATDEESSANAPKVDAELTTRQLLIRGTKGQIDQIRELLEKMGERELAGGEFAEADRQNVRLVPLTGSAAQNVLQQIEAIWPSVRQNRIKIVTPSAISPSLNGGSSGDDGQRSLPQRAPLRQSTDQFRPPQRPEGFQRFEVRPSLPTIEKKQDPQPPADKSSATRKRMRVFLVGDQGAPSNTDTGAAAKENGAASPAPEEKTEPDGGELPVIVVSPTANGLVIASEDLDALDEFEDLVNSLATQVSDRPNYTVFYLKYAKASVAADLLKEILGGTTSEGGAGGGGLLGDLAGAAMGDLGGGLLGGLLGLGGAGGEGAVTTAGSISFVPDARLNAVIVQGDADDVDLVERLLRVIDQESSPEDVQTAGRPRIIPVFNTSAAEIAEVVKQIYAEQISSSGGQQRQPTPEQFIRALRGGRGGSRESQQREQEQQKITIGVDQRNNALIVAAPEPLFQEIKALVEQLDQVREESRQTMRVVTLKQVDPATIQNALNAIGGGNIKVGTTKAPSTQPSARPQQPARPETQSRGSQEDVQRMQDIQRRIEFFNTLQRAGQSGRGEGGQPGRGSGRGAGGSRRPSGR